MQFEKPEYRLLPLAKIQFDYEYQRVEGDAAKWAAKTYKDEGWVPNKAGVVMVAEWRGVYYGWDGQGRCKLAEKAGIEEVWCEITPDCSPTQQASLFRSQRNRRGLRPEEMHRSGRVEGNPDSIVIQRVVDANGFEIGRDKGIRAVAALYEVYKRGGEKLLDLTLGTAGAAWADNYSEWKSDRVLKGMSIFYQTYPEVDKSAAIGAFAPHHPLNGITEAQKVGKNSGSNNHTAYANWLRGVYNRDTGQRLRESRLPGRKRKSN